MAEARARVRVTGDATGIRRASRESQVALQRISGSIRGLQTAALGAAAAVAGIGFAVKRFALDPFGVQQQALDELQTALAVTGKVGVEAFEGIVAEAQRLQSITQAGDEALIKATATLATLAPSLQADELAKAQAALVGLADTFFKGDLANAALILGKSLSSGTNALIRYGVELDLAADASGRLAQVIANPTVAAAFEISQAKVEGYAGSLVQLKNAIGDLQEVLGGVVAAATGVGDGFGGVVAKVQEMQAAIKANEAAWVAWVKVVVNVGKAIGVTVGSIARVLWNLVTITVRVATVVARGVEAAVNTAFDRLGEEINEFIEDLNSLIPGEGRDIQFRFQTDLAEEPLRVVKEQAAAIAQDVRDIADAYTDTGQAWVDAVMSLVEAANAAGPLARQAREALPGLGGGGDGGPGLGQLPGDMIRFGLTRGSVADRQFLPNRLASRFREETAELFEGMLPALFEISEAAEQVRADTRDAAGDVITAFGVMAQAAVTGSHNVTLAVVNMFTQIGQALTGPTGIFSGFLGGLGGPLIGAVGGLIGALVGQASAANQPQPVRIEGLSERAVSDFNRVDSGPEVVSLQFVSATTGEVIADIETLLRRRQNADAVQRIPFGMMLVPGGGS